MKKAIPFLYLFLNFFLFSQDSDIKKVEKYVLTQVEEIKYTKISTFKNPYGFKEKIGYVFAITEITQFIDRKCCIANMHYNNDTSSHFFIDLSGIDVSSIEYGLIFLMIASYQGTYEYLNTLGSKMIIPSFKYIAKYPESMLKEHYRQKPKLERSDAEKHKIKLKLKEIHSQGFDTITDLYEINRHSIRNPFCFKKNIGYIFKKIQIEQFINRKSCLANIIDRNSNQSKYFFLELSNIDVSTIDSGTLYNMIGIYCGTYEYINTLGSKMIVPWFKYISEDK